MASNAEALSDTQTLAMLLEFLARLQEQTEIRDRVINEITEKVKGYVKDDGRFATEGGSSGYLFETIDKSKKLRSDIVKSEKLNAFQHYNTQFQDEDDADKYTEHLINNIFSLFGCLYYMYYECASECYFIEGSEWDKDKCDGTGGDQDKDHLNKWLKDDTQDVKAPDRNGSLMIKRGFQDISLSTKTGNDLFPGASSNALLYFKEGAQLQFALYYMLFSPDDENWDHAQSGHAVLFLESFCEIVKDGQFFKGLYVDNNGTFKQACQKVQESINTLLQLQFIVPVAHEYKTVKYRDLLEAKHFWNYLIWLKDKVTRLGASLLQMKDDAKNWNKDALKSSQTYGPFPWGFVFKDQNWTSGLGLQQKLKDPLQNLCSSLQIFQKALDKIEPVSTSASTLGRVIGGLGAAGATAGAAYAGSGFLGPAAEAVGRFFKGLIL